MVNENKKYRVLGYNVLLQEWFISNLVSEEEATKAYMEMSLLAHYNDVKVVKEMRVVVKEIYTLE